MLMWLRNIDFGATEVSEAPPDSIPVPSAVDVPVGSEAAVPVLASPDVTIQSE